MSRELARLALDEAIEAYDLAADSNMDFTPFERTMRRALSLANACGDRQLLGRAHELDGDHWELRQRRGLTLASWGYAARAFAGQDDVAHSRVLSKIVNWFTFPRVFVSYAWADDAIVNAIIAHLDSIDADVICDRRDFIPGVDLAELTKRVMLAVNEGPADVMERARIDREVRTLVDTHGVYLLAWSRTHAGRAWPGFEVRCALTYLKEQRERNRVGPRIIIARLDDHPTPDVAGNCLSIDVTKGLTPIAKDLITRAVKTSEVLPI